MSTSLERKTKAELIDIIKDLKKKVLRAEEALHKVDREFKTYRAIKEGVIGANARRNPQA